MPAVPPHRLAAWSFAEHHLEIVVPVRDAEDRIAPLLDQYDSLGLRPLFIVDRDSRDRTLSILQSRHARLSIDRGEHPRVESLLFNAIPKIDARWILRFDDDELPTRRLLDWVNRHLAGLTEPVVGLPRLWVRVDSAGRLEGSFCDSTGGGTVPDWQFRLFRPAAVRLISDIHTPGFVLDRYALAPDDALLFHLNWIVRTHAERLEKVAGYDGQSPGAGRNFVHFYLPEDHDPASYHFVRVVDPDVEDVARRLTGSPGARPSPKTGRDAVLYYSHFCSRVVEREIAKLRTELDDRYDLFVVGHCQSPDALRGIRQVPAVAYTADDLATLPYPVRLSRFNPRDVVGYGDLAPMRFFLDRPDYEHYWIVEYDVRFGGNWAELFADLASSRADLLCTTIQTFAENAGWAHWQTLQTGDDDVPTHRRVKGFMPFCRLSRALLEACDARYRQGWSGHAEALWPTVAMQEGLKVEDIGGRGSFTPAERRGRYYYNTPCDWSLSPGTFVYRPSFVGLDSSGWHGRFPGLLWHPVKEHGVSTHP